MVVVVVGTTGPKVMDVSGGGDHWSQGEGVSGGGDHWPQGDGCDTRSTFSLLYQMSTL